MSKTFRCPIRKPAARAVRLSRDLTQELLNLRAAVYECNRCEHERGCTLLPDFVEQVREAIHEIAGELGLS